MIKKSFSEPILDALSIMDEEYPYLSGVDEIAERVGLSTGYFHRLFRNETGDTPGRYLRKLKIEKSKDLLLNKDLTLTEISWVCGFADPCEFNKIFKKETGQTPGLYRKLILNYILPLPSDTSIMPSDTSIIEPSTPSDTDMNIASTVDLKAHSTVPQSNSAEAQKLWL